MSCAAHVSVGIFQLSGVVEVRPFVRAHPRRVLAAAPRARTRSVASISSRSARYSRYLPSVCRKTVYDQRFSASSGLIVAGIVVRVHAARDQALGLFEVARIAGQAMRIEQRVDRVAGAAAGPMKIERAGAARQPGVASIDPPEPRLARRRPCRAPSRPVAAPPRATFRAGQEVMQHQAGGVVVLVRRPAARDAVARSNRRGASRCCAGR